MCLDARAHSQGTFPDWVFSLPYLTELDLSNNQIAGPLPASELLHASESHSRFAVLASFQG